MKNRNENPRKAIKREDEFFVYIVQCRDGTYYTGYTNDLKSRVALHNSGNGAKYLRGKLPVKLVYAKEYHYYKNALHGEKNIKKLTREQKEKLIRIYEQRNS
jgi:putative endonuclease